MKIDGGCHCGHISYNADIDPEKVWVCHCTDCQVLSGAPFRVSVTLGRPDLRMTANPPKNYVKIAESGRPRHIYFCPECGAQIYTHGEGEALDVLAIRWGTINQRRDLPPKRAIYCRSSVDWLATVPNLPGTETV